MTASTKEGVMHRDSFSPMTAGEKPLSTAAAAMKVTLPMRNIM